MNKLGISSACYYPQTTEDSFRKLCEAGIKCSELFFNSPSELEMPFLKELGRMKDDCGMEVVSVHPFMSFAESFYLFSSYERRFSDILPLYETFFEACNFLGAGIFVIHGAKIPGSVSDEVYCERFAALMELGKKYGVSVCQENVVHYRSETAEYLKKMQRLIGDDFGVVLDIKQARRAHITPYDIVNSLGKQIKHVHISDYTAEKDCVPPLSGKFDFPEFFTAMKDIDYRGAYIIELYDHSYSSEREITDSYTKIHDLLVDL